MLAEGEIAQYPLGFPLHHRAPGPVEALGGSKSEGASTAALSRCCGPLWIWLPLDRRV